MKIPVLAILAATLALASVSRVTAEPLTPAQVADILEKLQSLEKGIESDKLGRIRSAVDAYRAGVQSDKAAVDLYLECYRLLHFTRNDASTTEYLDWKNQNKDRHGEDSFQKGLRLQLQYLVLTMRAAEETDEAGRARLVRDVEAFLETTVPMVTGIAEDLAKEAARDNDREDENRMRRAIRDARGSGRNDPVMMLRRSVLESVFAQAYEVDKSVGDLEGWEMAPLGLTGIYSETILPHYGAIGVGEMGRAWDRWIEYEVRLAKATQEKAEFDEFMGRTVPGLRWKKAVYFYQVGYQAEGASEMMKLITANRGHPLLPDWYEEFRGLLMSTAAPPLVEPGEGDQEAQP